MAHDLVRRDWEKKRAAKKQARNKPREGEGEIKKKINAKPKQVFSKTLFCIELCYINSNYSKKVTRSQSPLQLVENKLLLMHDLRRGEEVVS